MAYDCTLIETYSGFGPELTTDGNMEDDPTTNWPGTGANVLEELAQIHGGCLALEVTATAAPGSARQSVTVEAGHRYRVGVWGLCDAGTDQWRVTIYATTVRWTSDWHNNAVSWEEEVKFYRVPDGITTIEIRLEVDQIGDVVYFDDVSVRREAPVEMNEIDLLFRATDDWALLDQGISINDPAIKEIWGGELEDKLVHRSEGKRVIPMELNLVSADADTLIGAVNGLEEMLRHAARYRIDGWGGEVFLQFKTDNATHYVWYPVLAGRVDKRNLMKVCNSDEEIDSVPATIICEAYWESPFTYDLFNVLDNPGFEEWNGTGGDCPLCDCEPDCWTDHESVAGGTATNQQETDTVEEGCEALRIEAIAINNGDWKGVRQDIQARIRADTEYTLLVWLQNEAITNGVVWIRAQGSVSGTLCTAVNSGAANTNYTQYECQFTPAAGDIAGWTRIEAFILGTVNGCTGIAHVDKMLVMEASNVPTGWMSSSYLENHYDRDANEVNLLSVCDIPGEVDAECEIAFEPETTLSGAYIARRTQQDICNRMVWQLIPCEGYTRIETGAGGACTPGLTDAALVDSDKVIDATSPSGSHINVDFLTDQTMRLRAYWHLTQNLEDYRGKYSFVLLCKKSADTDTVNVRIDATTRTAGNRQGYIIEQEIETAAAGDWNIYDGWQVLSWPIGEALRLQGVGDFWQLRVSASITGAAAWDNLQIAGAYLMLVDERYSISGSPLYSDMGAGDTVYIRELDGVRGCFGYDSLTDYYLFNRGFVGELPLLSPDVINWLYFAFRSLATVDIDEGATVRIMYRPRGIFLRGTNP